MVEIFCFFVGAAVGWLVATMILRQALARALAQALEEIERELGKVTPQTSEPTAQIIPARVEFIQDTYYLFREDTNAFLAQGTTAQELREHIQQRFRKATVDICAGDEAVRVQLQQKVQELNEMANAGTGIESH
jgi:DNA-binding protein YbaB